MPNISETITENIFRNEYGAKTFIEKSAIPARFGFKSKKETGKKGYPDFFRNEKEYCIVVEAKAEKHKDAQDEVRFYMLNNKIDKDVIGIAVSGQRKLKVTYYFTFDKINIEKLAIKDVLLPLYNIYKIYRKKKYPESISSESLKKLLSDLNKKLHNGNKVKDTDRSLFFSGIMIALSDNTFRNTYRGIQEPSEEEIAQKQVAVLNAHNLNSAIIDAIKRQLASKINNLSKEFVWEDRFAFFKAIDYSLDDYKEIIKNIEQNIYMPFHNGEKQDILGRAYKIFLSRAGKVDNKNIIITPDHIKSLMVKLCNLNIDDIVLDTCAGTGGFLMEAMENLIYQAHGNEEKIKNIKEKQLIGFEIDSVLFSLACSNMFLHGDGRTNLLYRSSLLNNKKESIANSSDNDLIEYIRSLKPTKCIINPPYESNNAFKFTVQALEYIEPNGRLVIIMPSNTLTKNQGNTVSRTEKLLETATLDFVIKMPFNLFTEQGRNANTSIFGFTKSPHPKNKTVMFYTLEDDGFVSIQHKGRIDKYNRWDGIESQIIDVIVNSKEIKGICEKRKIYKEDQLNVAGILNKSKNYSMVKIMDVFDIERGSLQSESNIEGEYDFITAGEEWKTHEKYDHDCEAIVYAVDASGSLGRSHYVNGKFIASNLCLILTPKSDTGYPVLMQVYNDYFSVIRKRIVSDLADGGSKIHITKEVFENYYIDYIPYNKQKELYKIVTEKNKKLMELKKQVTEAENKINEKILELI